MRDELAEHPYQLLGLAAGVGFLLGGGMRPAGRAVLALAGRYLLGSLVEPALRGLARRPPAATQH